MSTAYSLRNLCLYLHNEKGKTQIAYQLIQKLRKYLSNLDDISNKLLKDEEELSEIIKEADEYAEQERNNRQADKVYSVDISGDKFVIPPYCTCCLKPTSLTEDVRFAMSRDTFGGTATKTISVHMPICPECLEHRKQFTRKNVWICILCILFGVLASFMTYLGFKADKSNAIFIGAAVTTALYFVITLAIKVTPLSDSHSTRFRSVDISAPLLDEKNRFVSIIPSVTFTFTNWRYANLFQKANASKASSINSSKKINSAKKHSIFRLKKYVLSTLVGILFVSVILSLISININYGDDFSRNFDLRPLFGLKSKAVKMHESKVSIPEIVNYSDSPNFGAMVYADIISIEPFTGIYDSQDMTKRNNAVICEGKTYDGTTVWIYMTIAEYKNNIDDSAFLTYSSRASYHTIEYSPAARIYGSISDADLITPDLSTTISGKKVMKFKGIVLNDTEQMYGKANDGKALVPISVDNGEIFISPDYEGVCPLNFISKTKTDYYIYLEYQEPLYRTVDRRDQLLPDANAPFEEDIAFYLKAGQQVNLKIPFGNYKIYFATGDCFYGKQDLFGPETLFYVSIGGYYFRNEPQYFTGETITLDTTRYGSTDVSLIIDDQFPSL